ncbi:MAG: hypothetical protein ICV84_25895, partial [Flavisolibacter sp.]|nr:hypothetical protein [Flavisolibacter sp.]
MKKSSEVILTTVMLMAIISCRQKDEWIAGDENGRTRDTVVNNHHYRYYGGVWYPIYRGLI